MKEFILIRNNHPITNDLLIAKAFGKRPTDIKRTIRNLNCSIDFRERNFTLTSYIDKQGKKRPTYEITKDGFVLLVMGFTGKRAIDFKIAFIEAFNEMERFIHSNLDELNKICHQFELGKLNVSHAARFMVHWKKTKPIMLNKINCINKTLQQDLFEDLLKEGGV